MAKNPKLDIEITAKDKASAEFDAVAKKADKLDGTTAEVDIDANDKASDELADIRDKLGRLDGEEAEVLLKAEAAEYRKDLKAAQKQLIALDDEEAEVEIKADIAAAKAKLDAIDTELAQLDNKVVEPEVKTPDAEAAGFSAGDLFGAGAIKGLGVAGIGAAIAKTFSKGVERIRMRRMLAAEFNLVKSDAARLSREAGKLYADGFGEGVAEIASALAVVERDLINTGLVSQESSAQVVKGAQAVADVFGADVSEVIRSVNLMLANGMAGSAEEATDALVFGMQEGANRSGDLLETLEEYPQHFARFGLDADDAMMILQHGMQNGQRDTDKLADAIKEMSIRATDGSEKTAIAMADVGLNADEMAQSVLAGGERARGAFVDIINAIEDIDDPVERNRVAVELLGTQYEDLGPNALASLGIIDDAFADTTGRSADLTVAVEKNESAIVRFGKSALASIWGIGEAFAETAVGDEDGQWGFNAEVSRRQIGAAERAADEQIAIEERLQADKAAVRNRYLPQYQAEVQATRERTDAAEAAADAILAEEKATEDFTDALSEEIGLLQEEAALLQAKADARRDGADLTRDIAAAERELTTEIAALNTATAEGTMDLEAWNDATQDAIDGSIDLADDQQALAEATAAANGTTLSGAEAQATWLSSMLESAQQLQGPQRDAILGYISDVTGIPVEHLTEIVTETNPELLDEAAADVLEVSGADYPAMIDVDANTAQAESKIRMAQALASKTVQMQVTSYYADRYQQDRGGTIPAGRPTLIAEKRPEFFNGQLVTTPTVVTGGGSVTSGQETARILNEGGGGGPSVVNYITQHFPKGTRPEDVAAAQRKYNRRNGIR